MAQSLRRAEHVLTVVDPIRETHLSEPGLLVIDVAGFDDDRARLPGSDRPQLGNGAGRAHHPGCRTAGVRLRLCADLRQVCDERFSPERARWSPE
ncbi:hypothetical protein QFZ22_000086 [Streptomyces canus]|uniref:Uncharacterized protein n=1 Tax=Streptomyces canus TaxID=58343 RepID=A0AAW8F217_9ACTN|nr:hypothetical protein [Streptomyces canus]